MPDNATLPKPEDLQAKIEMLGVQAVEDKYEGTWAEWDCIVNPQESQDMTLVGYPPRFPKLQTRYRLKGTTARPNSRRTVKMRGRLSAIQDWRENPDPHIKIIFEEAEVVGLGQDAEGSE